MNKYRSHKVVEAAKIWQIIRSGDNGELPPGVKAPVICYTNPDGTVGPYVEVEESFFGSSSFGVDWGSQQPRLQIGLQG